MALCIYPKEHEWRLIREYYSLGVYNRRFYCVNCRTVVEDKKK